MSDNLRRQCAILVALKQHYPTEPTGNLARHLQTVAALVSGIVASKRTHLPAIASKRTHLPAIASKVPDGNKRESRIKRFARFLQNQTVTPEKFFAPYAKALVASLPAGPLVLVMDGSQIGRGSMALMVSVLYECQTQQGQSKRALPLCWRVVKAKKGHFTQEYHRELLAQARSLVPPERTIIFLGDGEFRMTELQFDGPGLLADVRADGPGLLADVRAAGGNFVCRTAKNTLLAEADWPDETFRLSDLMADGILRPGASVELPDLLFTAQGLGPLLVAAVWEPSQDEPLLLVSNLDFLEQARDWYRKRFGIETLFSDQKSRGFYLCHSHLWDPARLCRLLIVTCLAYYWLVCLGAEVVRRGWQKIIHRSKRCDLSLFQLGLVWLEHCLNEGWHIPVRLQVQATK